MAERVPTLAEQGFRRCYHNRWRRESGLLITWTGLRRVTLYRCCDCGAWHRESGWQGGTVHYPRRDLPERRHGLQE